VWGCGEYPPPPPALPDAQTAEDVTPIEKERSYSSGTPSHTSLCDSTCHPLRSQMLRLYELFFDVFRLYDYLWLSRGEGCAMTTFEPELLLPKNATAAGIESPMVVATNETNYNVPAHLIDAGIDFQGLWWMMGNPVPEEVVSFAGTITETTDGGFPITLRVPNSGKGKWAWPDTFVGAFLSKYYSIFDSYSYSDFIFDSPTHGEVTTGLTDLPLIWVESFPFVRLGPDEWLRPTYFQDDRWASGQSPWPQTNYTLVRIVTSSGEPHPVYWPLFIKHMSDYYNDGVGTRKLRAKATNDGCTLKCEIFLGCYTCRALCSLFG